MSDINDTVSQGEDGLWAFLCPSPYGCGTLPNDPNDRFVSSGWPTAEIAKARGLQHIAEHVDGTPMQELHDFRVAQGMADAAPEVIDLSTFLDTPGV